MNKNDKFTKKFSNTVTFFISISIVLLILISLPYFFTINKNLINFALFFFHFILIISIFNFYRLFKKFQLELKLFDYTKKNFDQFTRNSINFLKRIESIYNKSYSIESNNEIDNLMISLSNNLKKIDDVEKIEGNIEILNENIHTYLVDTLTIIESFIEKITEKPVDEYKKTIQLISNNVCPICYTNTILNEWQLHIKSGCITHISTILDSLERIKTTQESHAMANSNLISNFIAKEELTKKVSSQQIEADKNFFSRIDFIKNDFLNSVTRYFEEFNKIHKVTKEIEEISESIRMIALNLSIEASKTHNKAFIVIAKELQNLSLETQNFTKNIVSEIENSIKNLENEKEVKIKEANELSSMLDMSKSLNADFQNILNEIFDIFKNITDQIEKEDQENRKNILKIFSDIQTLNIQIEILEHFFSIMNSKINEKIDSLHRTIGGKKGACDNIEFKYEIMQKTFEEIEKIITTKDEINFFNNLKEKVFGIKEKIVIDDKININNEEKKIENVIIF